MNDKPFDGYNSGMEFWRDNAASYGTDEAAAICTRYFQTHLKRKLSKDERQFCREVFAAMYEALADKIIPSRLVYPYDFKTAADERWESSFYHKNRELNENCAQAIDEAINGSSYEEYYYNLDLAAMLVISSQGFERVNAVLAYQIQKHSYDGRYSEANKKWAKGFILPDAFRFMGAHAILVDSFAAYARELYEDLRAERFALLGKEEYGEHEAVEGYEIIRSFMYSETQGYAIACHPGTAMFVCWQFTETDGKRDYYWGIYGDEKVAVDGYNARLFVQYNKTKGESENES